ncbi:MAG: YggS family pyridoxal phosphate-dependent enzyme [Gemmatimonadota bacterium]|nr:YggS family pyridoxal phosphate-dependent enzyme [Gemmatimonadota bacterium]MDE3004657.1 YggS family pyridoxal phosphate-dependent enzyme [Gemmatimonadota bacterium]MDE3014530.1 YggS family pyridoxal phosphate-dependent enzyme [Gemmatimonadota bacterium]
MQSTLLTTYSERLAETLPRVREQIARAEAAAGRGEGVVRLIAVTKSHPLECVEAALGAGLRDLGENRVEELEAKVRHFGADAATWHMIGHLQSRKARRAVAVADVVHSVDSLKLARKVSSAAMEGGGLVEVLVQVNTSGEESKSGFAVNSAFDEIAELSQLPGLRVNGLMTMAPFIDDEVVLANAFASLRRLSESLVSAINGFGAELSMGMTNDLDVAIREGSTMVRIGTALFGPRPGYTT